MYSCPRPSVAFLAHALLCCVLASASLLAVGCGGEPEPTSPEGAYLSFRKALIEGQIETMWEQSDSNTHDYFERRHQTLVQMDETITDYLPQTDHSLARRQAGTVLLDKVDNPRELFAEVVRPQAIVIDQAKKIGLKVEKIQISEEQEAAVVITRAEQKFHLTREDESQWRLNLVESLPSLRKRLEWVDINQSALEKTVDKRIAEEQKRREAIIADLMGVESTGDDEP